MVRVRAGVDLHHRHDRAFAVMLDFDLVENRRHNLEIRVRQLEPWPAEHDFRLSSEKRA